MSTIRVIRTSCIGGILVLASVLGAHAQSQSPALGGSPMAVHDGPLVPGTYSITPFVGTEWDPCPAGSSLASAAPCANSSIDDDIRFTFALPDGWAGIEGTIWREDMGNSPPGGAGILFGRGGSLYSEPCLSPGAPDIPVGSNVDDFVTALVDHPLLDVTEPVDVTLGGYAGTYLELQAPADVTDCHYFVWEPGIYAQGPDHLWHLWVLDVDGTRVVIRADTYPGTTQEVRDQIDAIMASLRIDTTPAPSVAPTIAPSLRPAIGTPADDGARIVAVDTIDERTRDLTIESPAVGTVKVRLLLPTGFDADTSSDLPVLYLLHGYGGDHAAWTYDLEAAATTAPTDLLVVMPDADNGWYADAWNDGAGGPPKWETFHLTELAQLLERNWKASDRRVIAGLSMGGLGAMSYAARHPGMFRAAASYSGVLDTTDQDLFDGVAAFGDPIAQANVWAAHNPLDLAAELKGIPLYVSYGNGEPGPLDPEGTPVSDLEVWIAPQNDAFVARLGELDIPVTVDAYGPGTHEAPYWARALQRSLPMLLDALGEDPSVVPSPAADG